MADFTYTPIDGTEIDLGKYAGGVESEVAGRWGRHPIPGQKGDLKEDLGDGSLKTTVTLQFVGKLKADYAPVIGAMSKNRRGVLLHPRRGARNSVIDRFRERVQYTDSGEATIVTVYFEDAVIGQADAFTAGPSARAQQVVNQAQTADQADATLQALIFSRPNLQARAFMVTATSLVTTATDTARAYAAAAQESFSFGVYDPVVQAQLLSMPAQVQAATVALQRVSTAADTQETVLALEVMLFNATQLDVAIRTAQPIPIEVEITKAPGQNIYQFCQQRYGKSGKTPADMRQFAQLILRLNPNIRTPALLPVGSVVVAPVA